jgi:hypothetical protein
LSHNANCRKEIAQAIAPSGPLAYLAQEECSTPTPRTRGRYGQPAGVQMFKRACWWRKLLDEDGSAKRDRLPTRPRRGCQCLIVGLCALWVVFHEQHDRF